MSIFGKTLSIWKLTKLSSGQGVFKDIFRPAGPFASAFSVTSRLQPNKNRIKSNLYRGSCGAAWLCRTINHPVALRAMGNIYFGFSSVVDSGDAEGFLFVDQELHLIKI